MRASEWLRPWEPMVEVVGTGKEEGCSKFRARELEGEEGAGMAAEVGLREGPADI